ncbi:MAG: DUF2917 domain-containing protein [Desulforhabdus sp.]|jgi:hypothetical protein|nr:DUF2917 domain-containing protein [Desulforhabdus sp.]
MVITVSPGAFVSIDLIRQKCLIECLDGKLWITKTGNFRDICLEAGGKCELSGSGKIVIGAVAGASIGISGESGFVLNVKEIAGVMMRDLTKPGISHRFSASGKYNPFLDRCC